MIQVIDESRKEKNTTEGLGKSLTFDEGIAIMHTLPDSMYLGVIYNERIWDGPKELRPKAAIEFIKSQFLRDEPVAICVDYYTQNFDKDGKRLTTHKITFELYDEIFGIIGKQIILDSAPSKSHTVIFYERTNLPGIRNWIARKLQGEQFNSLDYRVLNH